MPEERERATEATIKPKSAWGYHSDYEVGRVYLQLAQKKHAQLSLRAGLKKFGKGTEKAVDKGDSFLSGF